MNSFCWNCFQVIESSDAACTRCGKPQQPAPGDLTEKLMRALRHPVAETRRRVAFLLGEKRVRQSIPALTELIREDADPYVVEEVVAALEKTGGCESLSAIELAARHATFFVRERAIEALLRAGGEWARKGIEIAASDPSATVRDCLRRGSPS
jgi:HEAT repeat protein